MEMSGEPGNRKAATDTDNRVKKRLEDRIGEQVSSTEYKLTLGG